MDDQHQQHSGSRGGSPFGSSPFAGAARTWASSRVRFNRGYQNLQEHPSAIQWALFVFMAVIGVGIALLLIGLLLVLALVALPFALLAAAVRSITGAAGKGKIGQSGGGPNAEGRENVRVVQREIR